MDIISFGGREAVKHRCPTWHCYADRITGWCTREAGLSSAREMRGRPRHPARSRRNMLLAES